MSKIEESNYKNTHEAKDTQTMIKDGLDVRDKPFSRQCGSASSLKVETQNKINASNKRTTSLHKVKIFFGRSKYQKDVVLQQRKQLVSFLKSQQISRTFLSSAHLLTVYAVCTHWRPFMMAAES